MPNFTRRKILVASIGVATISYAFGCSDGMTSGNLPSPPPQDAAADSDAAHVHDAGPDVADGASSDAAVDATPDAAVDASPDASPDARADASADAEVDASADASSGD